MARPARTAEATEEVRSALLDTAEELYEAGGPDAMSFRALASAYGCSNTMPYSYFGSKAEIIDGLRIRAYRWLQGVLAEAAGGSEDPLDALQALAAAYVRASAQRPHMYELLYSSGGAMDERAPELVDAKLGALRVCQRTIEEAVRSAGVTLSTDPETAAHLFWVAAHGLVSLEAGGFLVVGRSSDDLWPTLFATMTRGILEGGAS